MADNDDRQGGMTDRPGLGGAKGGAALTRRAALGLAAGVAALGEGPMVRASVRSADPSAEPAALPRAPQPQTLVSRIGFGSCLHQDRPAPALEAAASSGPDLFLFLGDNVYGDRRDDPADLSKMRNAYATLADRNDMQRLCGAVPVMATWDDHDYGQNDGGADYPSKAEAQALFLDFWNAAPDDPRRGRPGVYSSAVLGPEGRRVQIILLDTRTFRSALQRNPEGADRRYRPTDAPGATLLGEAQWAWLETELRRPAELRVLASSIQILADGHGWERWGNFPLERQRLYTLIEETGARGLIALSGDRHLAALYEREDVIGQRLLEVTSSSLNLDFLKDRRIEEPGPHRVSGLFTAANSGFVSIDWSAGAVRAGIRDGAGTAVYERGIDFDALGL
ncbi:MAG: alkaline phosphatase D family protein [Alphaproteobacteria bacterium]